MKFFAATILTVVLQFGCQGQPGFMSPPPPKNTTATLELAGTDATGVIPASYIVVFRGEKTNSALYFSNFFEEYQYHYLPLANEFISDPRIKSIDILTAQDLSPLNQNGGWTADFDPPAAMQLFWNEHPSDTVSAVMTRVDFNSELDAAEVLGEWDLQGRVWFAEPNGMSYLSGADPVWTDIKTNYEKLGDKGITWHKNIGLIDALGVIPTAKNRRSDSEIAKNPPIIAVLDSGVDFEHELLNGDPVRGSSIWTNGSPGASGCANDLHGCNTTAPSKGSLGNGDVWPVGATGPSMAVVGKGGHGTHVAGIIAANVDSKTGVGGVCPVCQVMIVKVAAIDSNSANATPGISDDSQIRGLKYVTRFKTNNSNAVRIVNSSFGKYTRSRSVAILVDTLKKIGNGTLVIAAASNEDSQIRSYPAALANAVAVASLDDNNRKSSFSNFGPWVDVAAPGRSIVSTIPGKSPPQDSDSGTSMAAPVVAGAAGLFLALYPDTDFDTLRSRIIDCADAAIYTADSDGAKFNAAHYFPAISGEDVRRPLLGSGIVNVKNMILGGDACKGSVGRPLDRVTPGCSTIGVSATSPFLGMVFALPLVSVLFRRRRK